jgi:hypothetical protein
MKKSKFKISLDIHGVIDSIPETFSFISKAVINQGGEVHILTGGSWTEDLKKLLEELNIEWTHHFSVYDHLISINVRTVGEYKFPDGTIQKRFEDGHWDGVKAKYCYDNDINLHIDDTLIYNDHFKTPFCRLWSHNGKPKSPKKDVRHLD